LATAGRDPGQALGSAGYSPPAVRASWLNQVEIYFSVSSARSWL